MRDRIALGVVATVSLGVVAIVAALLLGRAPQASPGEVSSLPGFNALLNGTSALLLVLGYLCIRSGRVGAHRACMVAAFGVSMLFLLSYVAYHYGFGSRSFSGQGWIRLVYFPLLISHVVLAAAIVPLALVNHLPRMAARVHAPPPRGSLYFPRVVLRFGDRSARVLDALPIVIVISYAWHVPDAKEVEIPAAIRFRSRSHPTDNRREVSDDRTTGNLALGPAT